MLEVFTGVWSYRSWTEKDAREKTSLLEDATASAIGGSAIGAAGRVDDECDAREFHVIGI